MLKLYAHIWDILLLVLLLLSIWMFLMALDRSGWIMSIVMEVRRVFLIVMLIHLEIMIVITLKMLELHVVSYNC